LAIEGFELLAIVAVLAIVFLWGPQKVPDIARAIGQAKREYDRASKEFSTLANPSSLANPGSILNPASLLNLQTSASTSVQPPQDPIVIAAKSIGIDTEGKTKEELAREIISRTAPNSGQPTGKEPSVTTS
jgi:sec-independent protein translocase protein TatA